MSDSNEVSSEYYSMDKIARRVCDEKINACQKGIEHAKDIEAIKEAQGQMNETFRTIFDEMKDITKDTNEKFNRVQNYLIGILITIVGFFGSLVVMRVFHIGG